MEEENIARKEVIEMEKEKGSEIRERAIECCGESRKRLASSWGSRKRQRKIGEHLGKYLSGYSERVALETENKEKE